MSAKHSISIDKSYIVFFIVVVAIAAMVVYVFNGVFSSITKAYEVDITVPDSELKIDRSKLDDAYKIEFERQIKSLEIR